MPIKKLKDFLDKHGVKYVSIQHSPAFTAPEIAATAHIPGKELAKTVMVKLDGRMAMAVLPSSDRVDFDRLRDVTGAKRVELAEEHEFAKLFPGCEAGAMPPFGNLWNMDVFVAEALAEDEEIAFNAGNHKELLKLRYADFERLVHPKIASFA